MSERLNDSAAQLEEKANELLRSIAQGERDRETLWPSIRDFKIAQSFLFKLLHRNNRIEALESTREESNEPHSPIDVLDDYEDMLQKLDDHIRQEITDARDLLIKMTLELAMEPLTPNAPTEVDKSEPQ